MFFPPIYIPFTFDSWNCSYNSIHTSTEIFTSLRKLLPESRHFKNKLFTKYILLSDGILTNDMITTLRFETNERLHAWSWETELQLLKPSCRKGTASWACKSHWLEELWTLWIDLSSYAREKKWFPTRTHAQPLSLNIERSAVSRYSCCRIRMGILCFSSHRSKTSPTCWEVSDRKHTRNAWRNIMHSAQLSHSFHHQYIFSQNYRTIFHLMPTLV